MPRPAGVTIASLVFILAGAFIGLLTLMMIFGSIGLVQHSSGSTGIFGNGLLGGLGLFFGLIFLVIAAVVVALGVGLWRMQKWARLGVISLLGPCAAFFAVALLNSLKNFSAGPFLVGALFVGTAIWMIWYLSQYDVKKAFGT